MTRITYFERIPNTQSIVFSLFTAYDDVKIRPEHYLITNHAI